MVIADPSSAAAVAGKPQTVSAPSEDTAAIASGTPTAAAVSSTAETSAIEAPPESRGEEPEVTLADTAEPVSKSEAVAVVVDEPSEASDPMKFVAGDGAVEFGQVFARAELPSVAGFTAEQALSMLHSMPSDLPLRVKRLTVKATLDAVGQALGATPAHIVNDAGRKISTLELFVREVSDRARELQDVEDSEIERLHALIAEREAEKSAITRREESVFTNCRAKMDELDQVIAFFASDDSDTAPAVKAVQEEAESDELPSYLQEDAVKRLLGLRSDTEVTTPAEAVVVSPGVRTRR